MVESLLSTCKAIGAAIDKQANRYLLEEELRRCRTTALEMEKLPLSPTGVCTAFLSLFAVVEWKLLNSKKAEESSALVMSCLE